MTTRILFCAAWLASAATGCIHVEKTENIFGPGGTPSNSGQCTAGTPATLAYILCEGAPSTTGGICGSNVQVNADSADSFTVTHSKPYKVIAAVTHAKRVGYEIGGNFTGNVDAGTEVEKVKEEGSSSPLYFGYGFITPPIPGGGYLIVIKLAEICGATSAPLEKTVRLTVR